MLSQCPQKDRNKDAAGVLLRSFSVVFTVLSIAIVAHIDLRFNSKTVPILCPNCANYLPLGFSGKNCSKICRLS